MRVVVSTLEGSEIDADLAAKIDTIIEAGIRTPQRETYDRDEIGQKVYHAAVVAYVEPGTEMRRWALYWADPAERFVHDCADEAEAVEVYEDNVRQWAVDNDGVVDREGKPFRFDYTDVTGAPGYGEDQND